MKKQYTNPVNQPDWTPVTLGVKSGPVTKEIVEKKKINDNSSVKLDENDNIISIKYVPADISKLIISARVLKKLTRKQLANGLNLKEDILADIETGKAVYNGVQIAKIKKYLGIV